MITIEKIEMVLSNQIVNISTQFKIMITVSEGAWTNVKDSNNNPKGWSLYN